MKYLLENIETERLKFRLLESADFETWLPLFSAPNAAKFLALNQSMSPKELCTEWFDRVFNRYANDTGGLNVVMDKHTGEFIGQCGLLVQTIASEKKLEIGYSMLPKHWGKGYATEAAQKAKEEAFLNDYSELLVSVVHIENIGSATVAQRNGMSILKSIDDYHGIPIHMYGISKNEWK